MEGGPPEEAVFALPLSVPCSPRTGTPRLTPAVARPSSVTDAPCTTAAAGSSPRAPRAFSSRLPSTRSRYPRLFQPTPTPLVNKHVNPQRYPSVEELRNAHPPLTPLRADTLAIEHQLESLLEQTEEILNWMNSLENEKATENLQGVLEAKQVLMASEKLLQDVNNLSMVISRGYHQLKKPAQPVDISVPSFKNTAFPSLADALLSQRRPVSDCVDRSRQVRAGENLRNLLKIRRETVAATRVRGEVPEEGTLASRLIVSPPGVHLRARKYPPAARAERPPSRPFSVSKTAPLLANKTAPRFVQLLSDKTEVSRPPQFVVNRNETSPRIAQFFVDKTQASQGGAQLFHDRSETSPRSAQLPINKNQASPRTAQLLMNRNQTSPRIAQLPINKKQTSPRNAQLLVNKNQTSPRTAQLFYDLTNVSPRTAQILSDKNQYSPRTAQLLIRKGRTSPRSAQLFVDKSQMSSRAASQVFTEQISPRAAQFYAENSSPLRQFVQETHL